VVVEALLVGFFAGVALVVEGVLVVLGFEEVDTVFFVVEGVRDTLGPGTVLVETLGRG
jgi:hypothetical protein